MLGICSKAPKPRRLIHGLQGKFLYGVDGQEQSIGDRWESDETVFSIEFGGVFILGVNDNRIGRDITTGLNDAPERIDQQHPSQALPLVLDANGQAANQYRRYHRVTRQFPCLFLRKLAHRYARGADGVKTGNDVRFLTGEHEHPRDVSFGVLIGATFEIFVQFAVSTRESRPVMMFTERLDYGGGRNVRG